MISADRIDRDVPSGSDIEITISVDESGIMSAEAYVPLLDQRFPGKKNLREPPEPTQLADRFVREKERLAQARQHVHGVEDPAAEAALRPIIQEEMVGQVQALLAAAEGHPEGTAEVDERLRALGAAIDRVEDALEWPLLAQEAEGTLNQTRELVAEGGRPEDQEDLQAREAALREALRARDADVLRHRTEDLRALGFTVLSRHVEFWAGYLQYLGEHESRMTDRSQARQLLVRGQSAVEEKDIDALRALCAQLCRLLPPEEQEEARGYGGTTIR